MPYSKWRDNEYGFRASIDKKSPCDVTGVAFRIYEYFKTSLIPLLLAQIRSFRFEFVSWLNKTYQVLSLSTEQQFLRVKKDTTKDNLA